MSVESNSRTALVLVAHPDDETLWCGGFILAHRHWRWRVVGLCRAGDPDRAPRFAAVMKVLGADGALADLDDGAEQAPLPPQLVETTIGALVAPDVFDLVVTHGPRGEYTRHRRHEECCRAVVKLWATGRLRTHQLWMFAYEDGGGAYLPRVHRDADRTQHLADGLWDEKRRILTELYGFAPQSWEVRASPRHEGFWCFDRPQAASERVRECGGEP